MSYIVNPDPLRSAMIRYGVHDVEGKRNKDEQAGDFAQHEMEAGGIDEPIASPATGLGRPRMERNVLNPEMARLVVRLRSADRP